ncbi:MAG: hypothetical protein GWN46_14140, partial [Gammaproteobacteria bacterium]|nr:hypothetical protein [Gammaproteobacteria bacterium]
MKWSSPAMQRHSALAEYLSELGLEAGGEPRKAVPEALRHGKRTVPLDPWERAVLQDSYGTGDGTPAPYASLIAEGLAFWVKCEELLTAKSPRPATDSATQSQPPGEKAEELARELMQEAEADLE